MFPTICSEHCSPSGSPTDPGSSDCKGPEPGRSVIAVAPIVSEGNDPSHARKEGVRYSKIRATPATKWVCVSDPPVTAGHPPGTRDNHDTHDGRSSRQPE